LRKYLKR